MLTYKEKSAFRTIVQTLVITATSQLSYAAVVDFSNCNLNSSFSIFTQSEGPTYACGGIDSGVGNPINVLNGNKYEAVTDFNELPAFAGLSFSRFYNSQSHAQTALGYGWYSSFDIKLYEQPEIIQIRLETGQRINFKKTKIPLGNQQFVERALPLNPNDGWVEKKLDGSGWAWHRTTQQQDYQFKYLGGKDSSLAHITAIRSTNPALKTDPAKNYGFEYDAQQRIRTVINGRGQQLGFSYSFTKYNLPQVSIDTPIGRYEYFLDKNNSLSQVVYPDGQRLQYRYDPKDQGGDVHNLTSKWRYDKDKKQFQLISQWQYDHQDRAILSQHADGVEKVTISYDARTTSNMPARYGADKATVFDNIITNSLGQQTRYRYQIDGTTYRLLESTGAGCASCGEVNKRYRFNAQGLVAYAADLDSSGKAVRVIDLKYNNYGEVIAKTVSGIGVQPQTTSYEYESYQVQQDNLAKVSDPLLSSLKQQDYRRLKTESRNSVLAGKQYRKDYTYNQQNQLIAVKETGYSPLGEQIVREQRYGYDKQGRLVWEDGPLANGKTNSPKDSDITTYQYNDYGQLKNINAPSDQQLNVIKYDLFGRPNLLEAKDGSHLNSISINYQGNTLMASQYKYSSNDSNPIIISNKYDLENNLVISNIAGNQTSYQYDQVNRLKSTILNSGLKVEQHYDSESKLIGQNTFNASGVLSKKVNINHIISDSGLEKSIETRDGFGLIQQLKHIGQVQQQQDALNRITLLQKDGLGRIQTQKLINKNKKLVSSSTTRYQLGAVRQDTAGLTQQKWQDDFGRTVLKSIPAVGIQLYHYDAASNLIKKINETGAAELYNYDNASRLQSIALKTNKQNTIIRSMQYDGSKLIKQISNDEIQTWSYRGDGKLLKHDTSQMAQKSATVGTSNVSLNMHQTSALKNAYTWNETYKYDDKGQVHQETRRGVELEYIRHPSTGQIEKIFVKKDKENITVDEIQWSDDGLLTHYRLSTGQQLSRTYDSRGRLVQQNWQLPKTSKSKWSDILVTIKSTFGQTTKDKYQNILSNYIYDAANRLVYTDEAGQNYYQYDDKDQLTAVWAKQSNSSIQNASTSWEPIQIYAYDAQGNRRLHWQKGDLLEAEHIQLYHYGEHGDRQVQLLGVSDHRVEKGSLNTGYISRLTAYGHTGQPQLWWQPQQDHKTLIDYLPSASTNAPLWNTSNTSWIGQDAKQQDMQIQQQYNQQGMIALRQVSFKQTHQQRTFSQRNGYVNGIRVWEQQQFSMMDGAQHSKQQAIIDRDYVLLAGLPIVQLSTLSHADDSGDEPKIVDAAFNPIMFNRIGAPTAVYDQNNQIRWQTGYGAFGERVDTVSTGNPEAALQRVLHKQPLNQSVDDLRYAISIRLPGQNEDPITGLYDNGYRQYDSQTGRYLSPDPLGTPDGLNPYLYVNNNPLNSIDPLGLYQTDMHYYMTYFLAITAGIDSDNARRIALATQFVDTNDNTSPFDDEGGAGVSYINNFKSERLEWYHFTNNRFANNEPLSGMELGSWDLEKPKGMSKTEYLTWRLTSNLDKIPQLKSLTKNYKKASECGNKKLSMQFFGEYLHAFEDTFAHRDQNNDPFGVNTGAGHGTHGSHPDYTYNHYGRFEIPGNLVGYGDWVVNETRSIIEQEQVYKKLVEYNQTVLKNTNKVVPWSELKGYLSIYNAIPESLNHETEVGSLDNIKEKITYLQDLLNGTSTSQKIYVYDASKKDNIDTKQTKSFKTSWGYKPKQGGDFQLIIGMKGNDKVKIAGKDGYSIPQAISNRITVFKDLTKQQKDKYENLIWGTSVVKYKSKDGENADIVTAVQNYQLKARQGVSLNYNVSPFIINGTPPVK